MKKALQTFFAWKAVKIICTLLSVILVIVAVCNGVFASVALKEQKGTAVCDAWSEQDPFQINKIQKMDMGTEEFKILCITDVHIRNHATFGAAFGVNFILDGMSRVQLKKLIKEESPDLIIVTGDTVLTQWNDICLKQFSDFMDSFQIPWAHIYGNHDYEGRADKAKLSEVLLNSEYGLFECGPDGMDGMGNYIINLERDGTPAYSLFLFDNGQFRVTDGEISDGGINKEQIAWYQWAIDGMEKAAGRKVPSMAFMHVPLPEYKEQSDHFIVGGRWEDTCAARENDGFFEAFKAAGGTHTFAAHDHNNNFLSDYQGVQLNYVTKSSYNCYFTRKALGGTVITFDKENNPAVSIVNF